MRTMTIRLPDEKHERLKALASRKGVSLNKLVEEFSTIALTEFDAENRFRIRAKRGNRKRGLELLNKLEETH
jgi:predicted DNA-binding protein